MAKADFEFMKQFADHIVEALENRQIIDGRDKYNSPVYCKAEGLRIATVGEGAATVKVTLSAYDHKDRTFTIAVSEDD